ncbi:nucleoside hydrolase [Annulohypoxylon truncatum]|uniref:nucleoside hydrolase n=1 Tax=Annulohypoxylon truncatum TaxID=327061 RepID=UPI002007986A|nr:nucleoside hydrolase [Annulohypoxylon truncatum]KAI1209418.1 nucleoside hydrolase [Annulohypoxylon truncatum]
MAPKKLIIDTDPGADDVMAMLLALAASREELEVVLISVTYGNVALEACLRNVVAMFHVLDNEMEWRKAQGKPLGFEGLRTYKPIVAVGPEHALEEEILMADNFHGADGLHGVHEAHPHLSPADTWKSLFRDGLPSGADEPSYLKYFTPSKTPSHKEILRILKEEPANTVSICALGPLTNLALAASEDPETFLRVKEVAVMGGAVECEGNVTPVAEFNTYADAVAAARVFALTSPSPASTMPPIPKDKATLPPYPEKLSKTLNISLFPLDITTPHLLNFGFFLEKIEAQLANNSPLGTWVNTFMAGIFRQITSMVGPDVEPGLSLHDPLTVWYMLTGSNPAWTLAKGAPEDIRVETSGQWTHGMHVSDRRILRKPDGVNTFEVPGDEDGWLSLKRGNRINRYVTSPGEIAFAPFLMERIFG